jgi:phage FluMu protein Com
MSQVYRTPIRGAVQLVRCPDCSKFFLVHWYAKSTKCRFCNLTFLLRVSERGRNAKPPRDRVIASFNSVEEGLRALEKINAMIAQGAVITNEEARKIVA